MLAALFKAFEQLGFPASSQLFKRTDINRAIVKKLLELWHVIKHKPAILAHRIATER